MFLTKRKRENIKGNKNQSKFKYFRSLLRGKAVNYTTDKHHYIKTPQTYCSKSTATFPNRGTAPNKSNNKKQCSHSYDDNCWNQRVDIFKEVIIVIVCDKHIGSHVAQYACCCLQQTIRWLSFSEEQTLLSARLCNNYFIKKQSSS